MRRILAGMLSRIFLATCKHLSSEMPRINKSKKTFRMLKISIPKIINGYQIQVDVDNTFLVVMHDKEGLEESVKIVGALNNVQASTLLLQ